MYKYNSYFLDTAAVKSLPVDRKIMQGQFRKIGMGTFIEPLSAGEVLKRRIQRYIQPLTAIPREQAKEKRRRRERGPLYTRAWII